MSYNSMNIGNHDFDRLNAQISIDSAEVEDQILFAPNPKTYEKISELECEERMEATLLEEGHSLNLVQDIISSVVEDVHLCFSVKNQERLQKTQDEMTMNSVTNDVTYNRITKNDFNYFNNFRS